MQKANYSILTHFISTNIPGILLFLTDTLGQKEKRW